MSILSNWTSFEAHVFGLTMGALFAFGLGAMIYFPLRMIFDDIRGK